ncbi:MAG: thiamine pyrophosphate-dependent enzyme, partial [Nitrospirales bacterium]|nr:thiamine pyrophosphate-dependent enzyme [Nitrospirales bacterium]
MRPEEGVMQSRAQAMGALLELISDELVIICNGFPSREAHKLRNRDANFYMIGSMGATAGIGLGLALSKPEKKVIVFDGDGNV